MSPDTLKQPVAVNGEHEELLIDTSKMSEGQAASLEVAEAARGREDSSGSFAGRLLIGDYDSCSLLPFPEQTEEDRKIGDALVQRVSVFLAEHLDADEVDETRTIPKHVIEGLQRLGVLRMKVPKEYGGLGLSQVNYNRVIMAMAPYCASTTVLVSAHQSIGVPQPLKMFGTEAQKEKYLTRIADGELSAFALTESSVGSDPARLETTAVLSDDGRHYVLNGEKLWTTNGPIAQLLVVMAQTAPKVVRGKERAQITALIVETDAPGIEVVHRCDFMGLRGIHNGVLRFHDVRVPVENVVWGEGNGLKLALHTLNTGRLTLPAACTGLAKRCLAIVREWGIEREQWGQSIGRHEAGRDKISHIAATAFAMEAVTWLTSHWADQGRDIRIEAAMAKLFCSEAAWAIVDETLQIRGGRGYERAQSLRDRGETPYPVERMMRDTRINTIIEGTTDIMRLFLAREALDPHLKKAADLLRPGTPLTRKISAAGRMFAFYSRWYPRQIAGRLFPTANGSPTLRNHQRFIDRSSHRLASALFNSMVRYGPKLERRQLLLGHLMEVGTELFVMSATCAFVQLPRRDNQQQGAEELADLFCWQARHRIEAHFRALNQRGVREGNSVAGRVLDGELQWLEDGVIHDTP
jgi:hypothetical protein